MFELSFGLCCILSVISAIVLDCAFDWIENK